MMKLFGSCVPTCSSCWGTDLKMLPWKDCKNWFILQFACFAPLLHEHFLRFHRGKRSFSSQQHESPFKCLIKLVWRKTNKTTIFPAITVVVYMLRCVLCNIGNAVGRVEGEIKIRYRQNPSPFSPTTKKPPKRHNNWSAIWCPFKYKPVLNSFKVSFSCIQMVNSIEKYFIDPKGKLHESFGAWGISRDLLAPFPSMSRSEDRLVFIFYFRENSLGQLSSSSK